MGSYVQAPKLPLLLSDNRERKYEVTLAVERVCRDRRTKTSPKIWVELRSWNELTELDCESSGVMVETASKAGFRLVRPVRFGGDPSVARRSER
jgi:hypothetical protein